MLVRLLLWNLADAIGRAAQGVDHVHEVLERLATFVDELADRWIDYRERRAALAWGGEAWLPTGVVREQQQREARDAFAAVLASFHRSLLQAAESMAETVEPLRCQLEELGCPEAIDNGAPR